MKTIKNVNDSINIGLRVRLDAACLDARLGERIRARLGERIRTRLHAALNR